MIACPECGVEMAEDDLRGQAAHMMSEHPEVVERRREESRRWDGWEND